MWSGKSEKIPLRKKIFVTRKCWWNWSIIMDLCPLVFVFTLGEILGVFMTIEKFSKLMEKFLSKSEKRPHGFWNGKKNLAGGGFSQVLKENFSITSENFSMIINTPNIYPRVRKNMKGHKSILLDQFDQHFLVIKNFSEGGAFLRFS